MGKKKKQKKYFMDESIYSQQKNDEIANQLEAYVEAIEDLFILEGKKESEVKDALKTVKKACKNLREGKPEKVFDEERYIEVFNLGDYL